MFNAFMLYLNSSTSSLWVISVISSILQIRKPRYRKINLLALMAYNKQARKLGHCPRQYDARAHVNSSQPSGGGAHL